MKTAEWAAQASPVPLCLPLWLPHLDREYLLNSRRAWDFSIKWFFWGRDTARLCTEPQQRQGRPNRPWWVAGQDSSPKPEPPLLTSRASSKATYLFYLDLPLINQLSDHAGHRHHPRQHHYQGEKETNVVQESVRKQFSQHLRAGGAALPGIRLRVTYPGMAFRLSLQATEHFQEKEILGPFQQACGLGRMAVCYPDLIGVQTHKDDTTSFQGSRQAIALAVLSDTLSGRAGGKKATAH